MTFETSEGRTKNLEVRSINGAAIAEFRAWKYPVDPTDSIGYFRLSLNIEIYTGGETYVSYKDVESVQARLNGVVMEAVPYTNRTGISLVEEGVVKIERQFRIVTDRSVLNCEESGEKTYGEISITADGLIEVDGQPFPSDTLIVIEEFVCPG